MFHYSWPVLLTARETVHFEFGFCPFLLKLECKTQLVLHLIGLSVAFTWRDYILQLNFLLSVGEFGLLNKGLRAWWGDVPYLVQRISTVWNYCLQEYDCDVKDQEGHSASNGEMWRTVQISSILKEADTLKLSDPVSFFGLLRSAMQRRLPYTIRVSILRPSH